VPLAKNDASWGGSQYLLKNENHLIMNQNTKTQLKPPTVNGASMEQILGHMYSFMNGLKLFHWHVTGEGSYAKHMALDQAIEDLEDSLDSLVETTFAKEGPINIVIPETAVPKEILNYCKQCYSYVDAHRKDFQEIFTQSIIDDWQQTNKELQYRLIRLK
jgi:DNA-binding ferritin-like protein